METGLLIILIVKNRMIRFTGLKIFLLNDELQIMKSGFAKFSQFAVAILLVALYLFYAGGNRTDSFDIDHSCNTPLTFKVGEIDDRFHISERELIEIIERTSHVWSEPVGLPVAIYSEHGEVEINLVYDQDQQLTDRESQFSNQLREKEFQISTLEKQHQERLESYNRQVSVYQQESNRLQQSIQNLNEWVNEKNDEGGFNENQLQEFELRKERIDEESDRLNREERFLSGLAEELNSELDFLNRMINEKNDLVREYNETFSGTRRFTQGTYEWRGNRKWINIYQFTGRDELILVLAHEMGHALGLDHVDNPESVMHQMMGGQAKVELSLSEEDQKALRNRCGL